MALRLDGTNPLSHIGVTPESLAADYSFRRDPTTIDWQGFNLGTRWLNTIDQTYWVLVAKTKTSGIYVATWIQLTNQGDDVETITGNSGGAVGPDINGNINVLGDTTTITIAGNPGTNTLTVSAVGTGIVSTLTGDTGGPISPVAGNINILAQPTAGTTVVISGSGNTLELNVTDVAGNTNIGLAAGNLPTTGTNNTSLGQNAIASVSSGSSNTAVGTNSLANLTTGSNNIAIGLLAGNSITTGGSDIIIGHAGVVAESNTIRIGTYATVPAAGEQNKTFIAAAYANPGTRNTFVGELSGNVTLSATDNLGVGYQALAAVTTGIGNTAIGTQAMPTNTIGGSNTAVGFQSLFSLSTGIQVPDLNTAIGSGAGRAITIGRGNTIGGAGTLGLLTTGDDNTAFGYNALATLVTGSANCAFGNGALLNLAGGADENVGLGDDALGSLTTGQFNIAIGSNAGFSQTGAESDNIIMGQDNLGVVGETGTIRIGSHRVAGTTNTNNTFVGFKAGNNTYTLASAVTNTAVGSTALNALTTGAANTAVGHMALPVLTSGGPNEAFGSGALQACTTGGANVSIGFVSMQDATTANFNTAVGSSALNSVTTGLNNVGVGYLSLASITTGGFNTVIGQEAGDGLTTADSSNICINNTGTSGDSNTLRIGAGAGAGNGQLNRAFIHGIFGITTGVNDAIAVLVDSAGQLGTVSSSIRFKENVKDLPDKSQDIMKLRPVEFNFSSKDYKSIGLIAEEVAEVFPDMVINDEHGLPFTVRYQDLPILLLQKIQQQEREIIRLRSLIC